jgi:hypothetical protein
MSARGYIEFSRRQSSKLFVYIKLSVALVFDNRRLTIRWLCKCWEKNTTHRGMLKQKNTVCHFPPLFCPLVWAVGWVGYSNTISEPTGSDKLYVSNKIDPLHFYTQRCHPVKPQYFLAQVNENTCVRPAPTVRLQPQHSYLLVQCGAAVATAHWTRLLAVHLWH